MIDVSKFDSKQCGLHYYTKPLSVRLCWSTEAYNYFMDNISTSIRVVDVMTVYCLDENRYSAACLDNKTGTFIGWIPVRYLEEYE